MSVFLSLWFYWHSTFFQLISAAYAAIAVTSYFSLLIDCTTQNTDDYDTYFRALQSEPWGNFFPFPIGWVRACCGRESGIWRTPKDGLTWLNVSTFLTIREFAGSYLGAMGWSISI
jgi:hypothetical protein